MTKHQFKHGECKMNTSEKIGEIIRNSTYGELSDFCSTLEGDVDTSLPHADVMQQLYDWAESNPAASSADRREKDR